ncbi:DUF6493 family protein [Saccharopolyspora cebuensis]|uniref:DUF6493 family protein n=1 Tax=Saccharopolyspora cebuensis TaxID=418759 RepID=A0ABV4CRZ0_9PSEU
MKLLELVEAADFDGVLRALPDLPPEERDTACGDRLLAARTTAEQDSTWAIGWGIEKKQTWLAATLGCGIAPGTAADLLIPFRAVPDGGRWLPAVADLHPVAWRTELVERLRDGAHNHDDHWFPVVEHIVDTTGMPMPTCDAFLTAWLAKHISLPNTYFPAPDEDVLAGLRADERTASLLPLALERPGVDVRAWLRRFVRFAAEGLVDRGVLLRRIMADLVRDAQAENRFLARVNVGQFELLALTAEERVALADDLAAIVDAQLTRLFDDGTRTETEPALTYLRALLPTPADNAPRTREHLALLDRSLPVATHAQEVLIGLDGAGLLAPEDFSESCRRVLPRPEKKLVRAQLTWLDRVAKREPERVDQVVRDAALTFHNHEPVLQERALALVGRHLRKAGDAVLPELRTAAGALGASLAPRAAELLGSEDTTEPYVEVLPPVPEPQPVPGPLGTPLDVAEEVAAVIADNWDVVPFERALDGLVRHAARDRAALAAALEPVVRRDPRSIGGTQSDVYDVARFVRGDEPREWAVQSRDHWAYRYNFGDDNQAKAMLAARLVEAMRIVESGAQPFLLAVPTLSTGALDAGVLVERVAECERLDVIPAEVDFGQALLRVTPTADEQVLRAAEELRSDAGRRLARWLRDGGLPHQDSTPPWWADFDVAKDETSYRERWCDAAHPGVEPEPPLPPVAADLVGPKARAGEGPPAPFWVAQLPHHRDELAARGYLEGLGYGVRRWPRLLPHLAESGGPAGFAVHCAVARSMATTFEQDRTATVDALLVLAAREQLDAGLLGKQLAVLLRGLGMANRVHETLRAAAETGAHRTTWTILGAALPGLLTSTPVRGAGPLLALATECAARCGATGELPAVTELAARKGSSQLLKNARALRDVLS